MNICIKKSFVLPVLAAALGFLQAGQLSAQTFMTLYSFTAASDGSPYGGVVLAGNTLYGTTVWSSSAGDGKVFAINTDGTGFTVLHTLTGSDGTMPHATLLLSGNTLNGAASSGGSFDEGTLFGVNTDGTAFTTLYDFTGNTNDSSAQPLAQLSLWNNRLYGTAYGVPNPAGTDLPGAVFEINMDGTGFQVLHSFTPLKWSPLYYGVNSDGAALQAGLTPSGTVLYGAAGAGGTWGDGTLFALNTDGTGFRVLHTFTARNANGGNSDGAGPEGTLVLSGTTLYGTTLYGGSLGFGTVFKVNMDGTGFATLHSFTAPGFDSGNNATNSDGFSAYAGLILSGNMLYGTASRGGSGGSGTIFALNTDGTGFITLYSFSPLSPCCPQTNSDGANPTAPLLLSNGTMYGTTSAGGSSGGGTVFSISLPVALPQLTIAALGRSVILTWPTNASGFALQSTTNVGSSAVWNTNLPAPVVVNGQSTVTNPISGTQQFFRLSQ